MGVLARFIGSIFWALFFGAAGYFITWSGIVSLLGLETENATARGIGAVAGLIFSYRTFEDARWLHPATVAGFFVFPVRYALAWLVSMALTLGVFALFVKLFAPHVHLLWALALAGAITLVAHSWLHGAIVEVLWNMDFSGGAVQRGLGRALSVAGPLKGLGESLADQSSDRSRGVEHVTGGTLLSQRQAQSQAGGLRFGRRGVTWGGIQLPRELATRGFVAAGKSGSGKTSHLYYLLRGVLPTLGKHGDERAVIYDYKNEMPVFLRARLKLPEDRIVQFHPFDERSAWWDVSQDIRTESETAELTKAFFPPPDGFPDHEFFTRSASLMTTGVIKSLNRTAPQAWDLRDLLLALEHPAQIRETLALHEDNRHVTSYFFAESGADMSASVLATIAAYVKDYRVVGAQWAEARRRGNRGYCISEWLTSNDVLVIGHSSAHDASVSPVNKALLTLTMKRLLEDSEHDEDSNPARSWVVLDEVSNVGKLPLLPELIRAGRSYGACTFLGFQDIEALYDIYGEHQTRSILNSVGNQGYLSLNNPETAEWVSKFFGEREVRRKAKRYSRMNLEESRSEQFSREAVVRTEMLLERNKGGRLRGFFASEAVDRPWRYDLAESKVRREVPSPRDRDKRDFGIRPVAEVPLAPWSADERTRLGLASHPPEQAQPRARKATATPPEPPEKPRYRKHRNRDD